MAKKKQEFKNTPSKSCPAPPDMARFPELRPYLVKEWQRRRELCSSGQALRQRASAKATWCNKGARAAKRKKKP